MLCKSIDWFLCERDIHRQRVDEKRKVWQDICNSVTLFVYITTHFHLKQIDLKQKNKGGQKLYDVNVRAIYGCRQVGTGHEHLKKLCYYLNMLEPMLSKYYQHILLKLEGSAKLSQIKGRMYGAADTVDVGVSVDEKWQRKG